MDNHFLMLVAGLCLMTFSFCLMVVIAVIGYYMNNRMSRLETDFIKLLRNQDALLDDAVKMRIKERYGKNNYEDKQ